MKKNKPASGESKSLKTFYLYTAVVICIIFISLIVKLVSLYMQSTFNGTHHYTIAIIKDGKVKEIYAFSPQVPALAVLQIDDSHMPYASLGPKYGILADAQLSVDSEMTVNDDAGFVLWNGITHFPSIKTNATIIDLIRLTLLSKNIVTNNKITREISLQNQNVQNNTLIARVLNDPTLSSENVSIQIINASNVSGIGQRLGRVLTNMGANVVEVSTAQEALPTSKIEYFGDKSYTLDEVHSLTGYPISELTRQPIANIVITLGENSVKQSKF